MVNKDAVEELAAQLQSHDNLVITLEGSDNVELEIVDVKFEANTIKVHTQAIHS